MASWGWRGHTSPGESLFHLLPVSSNGGAKTKLPGCPEMAETQMGKSRRGGGGGGRQQLWLWSVISVGTKVQHGSCTTFKGMKKMIVAHEDIARPHVGHTALE